MRVAHSWLQEYLTEQLSPEQMSKALEGAGIEIEQIIYPAKLDSKVVVARVEAVEKHPRADKLFVAKVDNGAKVLQIVCGASNVRAGLMVALAQVGSVLPNGLQIKPAKIRGETSEGMLCSPWELGWGSDHEQIAELEADLTPGQKLAGNQVDDAVFDLTTAANRPDLLAVVGLAREVAAQTGNQLRFEEYKISPELLDQAHIKVKIEAPDKCARYMAAQLKLPGKFKSTPDWMVRRLETAGIRTRNPIVDITNYIMLEWGQPLHAFDASKIDEIVVRNATDKEKIISLDGAVRRLSAEDLVIANRREVIAIAGLMGGKESEVKGETREVILESATFLGTSVRQTAKRLGVRTEASARFERSLPVKLAQVGLAHALHLMTELLDAEPVALADQLLVWPWVHHIGVRQRRLSELAGCELSFEAIIDNLERLGFEAERFDVAAEARRHLGKPYVWGAKFKTHGSDAFDCSYLIDYIYSLIGARVGHTALGQFEHGQPVHVAELKPGDVVFIEGVIERSATDHYYTLSDEGAHIKVKLKNPKRVGHNGIYIGNGKVIHAARFQRKGGKSVLMKNPQVAEVPLKMYTENPGYLGARRYVEDLDEFVAVTAPWWRDDVRTPEDVLEEVIKVEGYQKIPSRLPKWQPAQVRFDQFWAKLARVRNLLRGLGWFEVNTYSFVSQKQLEDLGYDSAQHLKLANPISTEQAYLRSDLLPSLLGAAAKNANYSPDFGLFEISNVYLAKDKGMLPEEPLSFGLLVRHPQRAYGEAKTALDHLAREFNISWNLSPSQTPPAGFHTAHTAQIALEANTVGIIGELNQRLLQENKLPGSAAYLELDVGALFRAERPKVYTPISKYPEVNRDIAIVVNADVLWQDVAKSIKSSGLAEPEFISDYYGEDLPKGRKSLAIRLTMVAMERTLTETEIEAKTNSVLELLKKKFGAQLR